MVLGVMAENSLPFTMAPVLVSLAKGLSKDRKALNHLSMDRTSASYKMRFGMAKTYLEETVENMKQYPFSLNIDESTSTNLHRVLAVLVSYYSLSSGSVVIEHIASLDVIKVDAATLTKHITDLFAQHELPWSNLISILMDSCSVMRGCKSGLETRIRNEMAPHLLDIDGDTCHHIHNASKKFCAPFDFWVERLFTDLANDFKWSTDLRFDLEEICELLNLKFTMPERFVSHRWLSCFDVAVGTNRLMDAYKVFYYAFLPKKDHVNYHAVVVGIMKERATSEEARERIRAIQKRLGSKKLTSDGQERKKRIIERLLYQDSKTQLIINFYSAVLPLLKSYVCLFESVEPLVHKLMEKQEELFSNFLSCFIKPECITNTSGKQLKLVSISSEQLLPKKDMFVGAANKRIIQKAGKGDQVTKAFRQQASQAYTVCAQYLQHKLPLDSKLLRAISAIDPEARGNHVTTGLLNTLPSFLPNVLKGEDEDAFYIEVNAYQVDKYVPSHLDTAGNPLPIDKWWAMIIAGKKYEHLSKVVCVLLSCFHGPQVESSFNVMGDVLNSKSGRMKVETYSAIQTVKYALRQNPAGAVSKFSRDDVVNDPVDSSMCHNLRLAASKYKDEKQEKRKQKAEKQEKLKLSNEKLESKQSVKKVVNTQSAHTQKMEKKRRNEILSALAAKRKKMN